MKLVGAKSIDGTVRCERCGSDLNIPGNAIFVSHMDGRDVYANCYNCKNCGNIIRQEFERKKADR